MDLLEGTIRTYAWGSRTAIAELQGRAAPTPEPEAELWLGAHPASPATLRRSDGPVPLTEVISTSPEAVLGDRTVSRYGPRLPFLLKVLAAAEPLSLQAHPDREQAATGYAAEEAAGVARDAPQRTYVDAAHKPELLVALEPFDALCGFRDPRVSADLLAALDVPGLERTVAALRADDAAVALREAVSGLLTMPVEDRAGLVEAVVERAGRLADAGRLGVGRRAPEHAVYCLPGELAARYPGDVGVIVAMLLNRVLLAPGEAVWMPAGNLHAYLRGVGIEVMAASDNVLRGGLTPKPVNVPELLRVLRFEVLAEPIVRAVRVSPGVVGWPVPISDFALVKAVVDGGRLVLPGDGPRVVLCLRGMLRVDDGQAAVTLRGGQAAFAAASSAPVTLAGSGEVYQASVGAADVSTGNAGFVSLAYAAHCAV